MRIGRVFGGGVFVASLLTGCLPSAVPPPDGGFGGGDQGGGADLSGPGSGLPLPMGLLSDPAASVSVDALVPVYSGASIAAVTPTNEVLPMPMKHLTGAFDPSALSACANCHQNITDTETIYHPGTFHSSLANLKLAQPTTCLDCHATSVPTGFVGPMATSPTRNPGSGEMKHDAVAWSAGAPTAQGLVANDCGTCHSPPSETLPATWATGHAGTGPNQFSGATPVFFHSSLTAAGQPQPTSCIDCHANTRPSVVLTSANSTLTSTLQFDHTTALGDCTSCHDGTASKFTSWSGGHFHLAADPTPSTCLPCHDGERPTTTAMWASPTYKNSPFDYTANAQGIAHGDGQDCQTCHNGPGSGAWGGTQNWVGGQFAHGATTVAGTTCVACHSTQRPDLQPGATAQGMATLLGFDHSQNGTGDCFGCHQSTVAAKTYVNYYNPGTGKLPNGDWKGGQSYPGSTLISSIDQFITIPETTLIRSGANNLVTSTSSISATLYNSMLHTSTALPAALNAGPSGNPDNTKCWHCHANVNGTVTNFANGKYHASLTSYSATPGGAVVPFPQPTNQCTDCHSPMRPVNIVEKAASELQPMDHNAQFTAAVTIAGVQVTGVGGIECAVCHKSPGGAWSDGLFHANIGAAVPKDCTTCHYPVMADAAKADLTSGVNYAMQHKSVQLTFQNCTTCHTGALAKGANNPSVSTLWQGGGFHPSVQTQPTLCVDCHKVSQPKANASTQSSWSYTLPMGATASNGAQWMNHGASDVVGKDCVKCHAADAKTTGSAWSKADYFHAAVATPAGCQGCHGLTNGGGATVGTNNNMPQGNTNSTTVTSAASDVSTGVPMGTLDQISHTDVNVSGNDCGLCHSQAGISTTGTKGKEWAQATFHKNFGANKPLMMNTTTGRCSNCHMNVKPGASYAGQDHSAFTSASGTEDCSSCHSWPGTGTAASPNWLGAAGGMPVDISVGGFSISQPPATVATVQVGIDQLPHPTVANGVQCTTCHAANNFKPSNGYDHKSALINSNCAACHEAGSTLVGTVWNHAATESAGAGDTRPIGLTSLGHVDKPTVATMQAHFYPIDCSQCHNVPPGNGLTSTGGAYVGNGIGSPSGATCAPSGTQCASTGVACSNTAPCPNGQSCKNAVCVPNCPNGQSCKSSQCVVNCPNGQSCNNQICYLPPFWTFPHNEKKMSNPSTCVTCHTNGVPN